MGPVHRLLRVDLVRPIQALTDLAAQKPAGEHAEARGDQLAGPAAELGTEQTAERGAAKRTDCLFLAHLTAFATGHRQRESDDAPRNGSLAHVQLLYAPVR